MPKNRQRDAERERSSERTEENTEGAEESERIGPLVKNDVHGHHDCYTRKSCHQQRHYDPLTRCH